MAQPRKHKFKFKFFFLGIEQAKTSDNPIDRPDFVRETASRYLRVLAAAGGGALPDRSLDGVTFKLIKATIGNTPEAINTLKAELRECRDALDKLLKPPLINEKELRKRAEEFVDNYLFLDPPGEGKLFADDVVAKVREAEKDSHDEDK